MKKKTILIIGSGGREHALAWAISRSLQVGHVYVAPGNGGTTWPQNTNANQTPNTLSHNAPCTNVAVAVNDRPALIALARRIEADLTVVGPEVPLAMGIVDSFQIAGLTIFGPTLQAAKLESSKIFAKQFMQQHNIPTAKFAIFDDYNQAKAHLEQLNCPIVIKADGLAAGKGVIVCDNVDNNLAQAHAALHKIMVERAFGEAGNTVLIEERLYGPEISILAWCDGKTVIPIIPGRDHKRAYDGDQGPNTGGMGVYAPAPDISLELLTTVQKTVLEPTVTAMANNGIPYVGILYTGLMLTESGPQVLEFNCRFGDPETQAILPLLNTDLVDIFLACIEGKLHECNIQWKTETCATIVLASQGYPNSYPKGLPITGLKEAATLDNVVVFHAGTKASTLDSPDAELLTNGGRVLAVSALGPDLASALEQAYTATAKIHFEGIHYRRDIGQNHTALNPEP